MLVASDPTLRVYANEGEVAARRLATLRRPSPAPARSPSTPRKLDRPGDDASSRVGDRSQAFPYDLQVGEQLQRYFRPGRSVLANLVEALEDDQKDVRRLAISATRLAGGIALIVPLLHQEENPVSRRAAIQVLRATWAKGPTPAVSFIPSSKARLERILPNGSRSCSQGSRPRRRERKPRTRRWWTIFLTGGRRS